MKSKTTTKIKKVASSQQDIDKSRQKGELVKKSVVNQVYTELAQDGHEDFYSYLEWLGLAKKHDMLILTSSHHYYFEVEDLKNIRAVINLNKLNSIKRIKDFLLAVYNVMPQKCFFIGSFTDYKNQKGFFPPRKPLHQIEKQGYLPESDEGPWNSFLNMLYGLVDPKADRNLSKMTVQFMLEDIGLKILDITEFNGLTYFCTQKDSTSVE